MKELSVESSTATVEKAKQDTLAEKPVNRVPSWSASGIGHVIASNERSRFVT